MATHSPSPSVDSRSGGETDENMQQVGTTVSSSDPSGDNRESGGSPHDELQRHQELEAPLQSSDNVLYLKREPSPVTVRARDNCAAACVNNASDASGSEQDLSTSDRDPERELGHLSQSFSVLDGNQ